jgi:SAM-dependent MidA family methyltransferase
MFDASETLKRAIIDEIASRGPIPFARFMELCLYHPEWGYYSRGLGGGGGRDYLTSSGVHRAYGALLARQVQEMWRRAGRPDPFLFVEFGPGEGYFAADFVRAAAGSGAFASSLRYLMVETSPALRARQKQRLGGRTPIPVSWVSEQELDERRGFAGVMFANEVLDAFPVHRVVGTPDGSREIHVAARDGRLEEVLLPLSGDALARFMDESGIVPVDGQEVDLNLAAPCWMDWAVGLLQRGYLIVVDYGYEAVDLYRPERGRGTLLAYHRHRINEDFLARPGEQDLTAHIDFSALRRAAEWSGGRFVGLTTQSRFLLALGALDFLQDGADGGATETVAPAQRVADREALKELVLPERMGDRFRVLVLGVGDVSSELRGLTAPWRMTGAAAGAQPSGAPANGSPAESEA